MAPDLTQLNTVLFQSDIIYFVLSDAVITQLGLTLKPQAAAVSRRAGRFYASRRTARNCTVITKKPPRLFSKDIAAGKVSYSCSSAHKFGLTETVLFHIIFVCH